MHFTHLASTDIPARLVTDEFVLRPIVASDVELDYAAVMESKEYLRPWEQTGWQSYAAMVSFWVRTSRLASRLDERLLDALRTWLVRDGNLGPHLFVTNEQVTQQVELIEHTDLQLRFTIEKPTHAGTYLAYA